MRFKILGVTLLAAQLFGVPTSAQDAGAAKKETAKPSKASVLLFETPHFSAFSKPTVLRYSFERQAKDEDDFTDQIDVKVDSIRENGRTDVSFDFFTGERQRPYTALSNFSGNPLVVVFLQREVWALSRKIGGLARYFRYRIRLAMRSNAMVEDHTIETGDGAVQGHKITITPYEKDRHRNRLGPYEFTKYEFVVSPEIPGSVYSITTIVPAQEKDAPPLVKEIAVFKEQRDHPGGTEQ